MNCSTKTKLAIPSFDYRTPGRNLFNFDELFSKFDEFSTDVKFPKYNVLKYKNGDVELEIALAGYNKDELFVEMSPDDVLTISTKMHESDDDKAVDNEYAYITHGIASRNFKISWNVGSTLLAGEVTFTDGMLRIPFKAKAPKKLKVKTLKIT